MAPFLAIYFQDAGASDADPEDLRLYCATSVDGTTFNPIGLLPTNGTKGGRAIARDPSVLPPSLAPDGRWHIACTNHTFVTPLPNDSVDIYSGLTLDGIDPNPLRFDCSAAKDSGSVQWAWAPEWFKDSDGTIYFIVSTSTNTDALQFQFYTWAFPATNSSLTTFGAPIKLSGIPFGGIDCYVVKRGATYYAFVKAGVIQMYTATSFPAGPWTLVHSDTTPDAGTVEGPNVTDMGGGISRLYYDKWIEDGRIKYVDSSDTFVTFSNSSYVISPDRMRHATIIDIVSEPPLKVLATGGIRTQRVA